MLILSKDKSALCKLQLTVSFHRDKPRLDLREYYLDDSGEYRPSRKGITIPTPGLADDIATALQRGSEELRRLTAGGGFGSGTAEEDS